MAASRGMMLKAALFPIVSYVVASFHCSVGYLYLCYQAVFYFILLKHKFKSMNISQTCNRDRTNLQYT